MLTIHHLAQVAQDLLAGPTPTPTGSPDPAPAKVGFNFDGISHTIMFQVAPIILMALGIGIATSAFRGNWAKTLTTSAIAFIGIAFVAGSITFLAAGDWLVGLFFN